MFWMRHFPHRLTYLDFISTTDDLLGEIMEPFDGRSLLDDEVWHWNRGFEGLYAVILPALFLS